MVGPTICIISLFKVYVAQAINNYAGVFLMIQSYLTLKEFDRLTNGISKITLSLL